VLLSLLAYYNLDNDYAVIISLAILTIIYTAANELLVMKNKVALQLLKILPI
jgi:hypothetical protein